MHLSSSRLVQHVAASVGANVDTDVEKQNGEGRLTGALRHACLEVRTALDNSYTFFCPNSLRVHMLARRA